MAALGMLALAVYAVMAAVAWLLDHAATIGGGVVVAGLVAVALYRVAGGGRRKI